MNILLSIIISFFAFFNAFCAHSATGEEVGTPQPLFVIKSKSRPDVYVMGTLHTSTIEDYHPVIAQIVKEVAATQGSRIVTECKITKESFAFAHLALFEEKLRVHAQETGKSTDTIEDWKALHRKKAQEFPDMLDIDTPLHPRFLLRAIKSSVAYDTEKDSVLVDAWIQQQFDESPLSLETPESVLFDLGCLPSQEELCDFDEFVYDYKELKKEDEAVSTATPASAAAPAAEPETAPESKMYNAISTFVAWNPLYDLFLGGATDNVGAQKRNERWGTHSLPRILKKGKEGSLFIAVGISHLGGSHGTLETVSRLVGYGEVHQYVAQSDGSLKLHHFQDYSYVKINPQTPSEILALLGGSQ